MCLGRVYKDSHTRQNSSRNPLLCHGFHIGTLVINRTIIQAHFYIEKSGISRMLTRQLSLPHGNLTKLLEPGWDTNPLPPNTGARPAQGITSISYY